MMRTLRMNWRGILTALVLIVTINVVNINWIIGINHLKSNVSTLETQLVTWSSCVARLGVGASECESMANQVVPVWRFWVGELFLSLTGIETFLIESAQS
jgi:hypothetical protein